MAATLSSVHAAAQTALPADVRPTCTVAPAELKSWFKDNEVKKDGPVRPADSLAFSPNSLCSFYKWSEQMFLWLTSPLSPGRHTFNSSEFFAVSAPGLDGNHERALIRQDSPEQKGFGPSIVLVPAKPSVVTDNSGQKRPVVTLQAPANAPSPFVDQSNKPVGVARIAATADGKPILLDQFNKALDVKQASNGAPALVGPSATTVKLANATVAIGKAQRLLTVDGAVVDLDQSETGQATNDVLMTKDSAIVFYLIQVNDVFAYFKVGVGNNTIPTPQQLPTDAPALVTTENFAKTQPAPYKKDSFGDRTALAMELKSSWVDVETLPTAVRKDYLTIKADIPTYEITGEVRKPTGSKPGELALVGFHVVGTVQGHPEMVWATFEHVNNAPNVKYSYMKTTGETVVRDNDGPGSWLFSTQGAVEPVNDAELTSRARMSGVNIVARPNQTIGPVDVTRRFPWGSVGTDATSNTDIIAINNSVLGQLPNDDVRRKYVLIGALWTNGKAPDDDEVVQVGSKALANSTMETFRQNSNCFGCHNSGLLGEENGRGLSHIWGKIKAQFP
ncbi:hypothetical protein [Bradyrhizobium liaoningense]|uniref:hypothetical protein n=1 Tax=Bradyrhizobium liaoningense TaxID=43992 RepID=UPI001BA661B0|nr:hypothetical protein [Bradyrhizobium liaoningense]MBR0717033.1 hypothetical protein [Bradyrhizobium liaoningense]